jgi:hypothetical protein
VPTSPIPDKRREPVVRKRLLLVCKPIYKQEEAVIVVRVKKQKWETTIAGELVPEIVTEVVLIPVPDR